MRRDSGHGWRTAAMRPRMVSMRITLLIAVALAAHASGDERPTLRAAEGGVSPGFCPALRALVDEAPGGFSALRGAARPGGEHMWERSRAPSRRERLARPLLSPRSEARPCDGGYPNAPRRNDEE